MPVSRRSCSSADVTSSVVAMAAVALALTTRRTRHATVRTVIAVSCSRKRTCHDDVGPVPGDRERPAAGPWLRGVPRPDSAAVVQDPRGRLLWLRGQQGRNQSRGSWSARPGLQAQDAHIAGRADALSPVPACPLPGRAGRGWLDPSHRGGSSRATGGSPRASAEAGANAAAL